MTIVVGLFESVENRRFFSLIISKSENFQFWFSESQKKKTFRIEKPPVLILFFLNPKEPMVFKEEYTVLQMVV
jgi:hypothetical protein